MKQCTCSHVHIKILYIFCCLLGVCVFASFWYSFCATHKIYGDMKILRHRLKLLNRPFYNHPLRYHRHKRRELGKNSVISTLPESKNKKDFIYSVYDSTAKHINTKQNSDVLLEPSGEWLKFPSYSKIPVSMLSKVCYKVIDQCELQNTGPQGPPGQQGPQGFQGPPGFPGKRGKRGKDGECSCISPMISDNATAAYNSVHQVKNSTISGSILSTFSSNKSGIEMEIEKEMNMEFENFTTANRSWSNNLASAVENTTTPVQSTSPAHKNPQVLNPGANDEPNDSLRPELILENSNQKRKFIKSKKKCFINRIHESTERGNRKTFWGSWIRDSAPKNPADAEKRWVSEHFSGNLLLEFANEKSLKSGIPSAAHELPVMYDGTDHVMYKGSFYYHRAGTNHMVRYDLETSQMYERPLSGAVASGGQYLYRESYSTHSLSYMDFATDENGVWVIYRLKSNGRIAVSSLNPEDLGVEATWLLPKRQAKHLGNIFIACGVLYRVNSMTRENGRVDWAYNLYTKRATKLGLTWVNLYGKSTMINYNPVDQSVYVYDNGFLMTVALDIVEPGTV